MTAKPLKNDEIGKALGVSNSRVIALRKQGMPDHPNVTLDEIKAWKEARDLELSGGAPIGPAEEVDEAAAAGMTLDDRIARQRILVARAEAVWSASMGSRNANSSKFQTAYNQSLKTLVALEAEAFNRKVKDREYIKRADSEAVTLRLSHLVVGILDSFPDRSDLCNPDNPAKARKVLEEWVIEKRNELAAYIAKEGQPADA